MKAWTVMLAFGAIALAGCAATVGHAVRSGMTESQVRAVGGKPVLEQKLLNGETAWDYTLQPSGYFT